MFTVVITEKDGPERRLTFTEAEVTVGRVPGNDVVLPKGNVSKRHSRIVFKDNRFIVVDLKSTNGTYVNGRKITSPLVVKEDDKIYVGDYILTLESVHQLEGQRPPALLPTLSDGGLSAPMLLSLAEPLPAQVDAGDDLPPVLRGMGSTSIPMSAHAEAASGLETAHDDDDAILPAESELEVFEEALAPAETRAARGQVAAPVFPPPIEPHRRERIPRAIPLRPTRETSTQDTLLGPVDLILADPEVFHVVVERFDRIRADRGAGLVLEHASFASPEALVRVTQEVSAQAGLPPFTASFDISLANGLHVVAVQAGATSNGPVLSVRRRPTRLVPLTELVQPELNASALSEKVEAALAQRHHVWIVGPGGAELAAIAAATLALCGAEQRVAVFERAPEIALAERAAMCLKLGAVPVRELLERVRYLRPDRLVMHGLREEELPHVLEALAHQQDGSIVAFEARSAKDALSAFDRASGADVTLRAASLLVECKRGDDGKTHVSASYDVELDGSGELALRPLSLTLPLPSASETGASETSASEAP